MTGNKKKSGNNSQSSRISVTGSTVGVIGDNAVITGGIHFHGNHGEETSPSATQEPATQNSELQGHILHLSDLHFGTHDDAELWCSQLANDLKNDLNCQSLEGVIVSGDIANFSVEDEYKAASKFFTDLQQEFGLKAHQIVIVPGNHDLNWNVSKKQGYSLQEREDVSEALQDGKYIAVDEDVIRLRNEDGYKKRFENFSAFYADITAKSYPQDYLAQGMIHHLPELNLLILGLNSSWELDHHFTARASINPGALARSLNIIRNNDTYQRCLKIAVWHHPLNSPDADRITDHGFMEQLAQNGFCVACHGHLHEAQSNSFRYDMSPQGRKIDIIGAGTFGAPVGAWRPGIPLQYNLLKLHADRIIVHSRRREELNGAWKADAIWQQGPGEDPLPRYEITLPTLPAQKDRSQSSQIEKEKINDALDVPLIFPESYRKWLLGRCSYMDIDRLREKGKVINVDLPELFIPLYTSSVGEEKTSENALAEGFHKGQHEQNIEDLILTQKSLLVKGQAGSGKTTLLRHFCLNRCQQQFAENDLLPVLIFLKDCKQYDIKNNSLPSRANAENILEYLFAHTGNGLDLDTVKQFCRAGKAVFLFDGLDEIDLKLRDLIVISFADFFDYYKACTIVFSGRPHGFDGAVIERFSESLVEILPLNYEQVKLFVNKWFCTIMETNAGSCNRTAASMLGEMKTHEAIDVLKDTPLMLTAICLLYHDNKELPGQRAELYKKFIEYLLYRRFDNPEKVLSFLKKIAWTMHVDEKNNVRTINHKDALNILAEFFPAGENELPEMHCNRLKKEFDTIEPNCGLLRLENGMYEFWHLTFQEFLTAMYLADSVRDNVSEAVKEYWQVEWWHEVIELYVGYLSIQSAGMANGISQKIFEKKDTSPYVRWRLAAKALLSIHVDRRELEITKLATKHLGDILVSEAQPVARLDAGQLLGRLGDPRNLRQFIPIAGGSYTIQKKPITLAPFEVAQYPVTNAWFAEFIRDNGYSNHQYWTKEGRRWLDTAKVKEPRLWQERTWNCPNAPVVGICWYEATAFVRWLSALDETNTYYLLTEEQWQAAATGKDNREYPWKGDWQEDYCNTKECDLEQISPVGMFPYGKTPEGVAEMTGNVWEWTSSNYHSEQLYEDFLYDEEMDKLNEQYQLAVDKDEEERLRNIIVEKWQENDRQLPVLRGGSWLNYRSYARCAFRFRYFPFLRINNVGFRCARTAVK